MPKLGSRAVRAGVMALLLLVAVLPTAARAQRASTGNAPAVEGLKVTISAPLLNPDGSFILPEKRVYQVVASWSVAADFTGRYEVELARQRRGEPSPSYGPLAVLEAGAEVNGGLRVAENITFADSLDGRWCFRVRTVAVGGTVAERGAWAEACTVLPPASSAPPLAAPPAARMQNSYETTSTNPEFETISRLGWTPVPGFQGSYEVERAYVSKDEARSTLRNYSLVATVSAPPGADGWIVFEERVQYVTMWDNPPCYRARAVRGDERGPYSAERCAVLPTDTRPPAGRVPMPPDAGSGGPDVSGSPRVTSLLAVLLLSIGAVSGSWIFRVRRK